MIYHIRQWSGRPGFNPWSSHTKDLKMVLDTSLHYRVRIKGKVLYFDLRPGPKMLFQNDAPEGSDTFQWPVIERDRVGGLRLIIWDKVKVPRCHYSDAPEESDL